MPVFLTKKQWGGCEYRDNDGRLRIYRKPRDASQPIRQRKSKKKRVISRAKAKGWQRP